MIAFEYRPTVSLQEGIDALATYNKLKLQKAMNQLAIGSQFGDKGAIAEGLRMLGLSESAKRFEQPSSEISSEEGKKLATQFAQGYFASEHGFGTKGATDKEIKAMQEAANREAVAKSLENLPKAGEFSADAIKKLDINVLTNPDNIEKMVYSAPDQPTAIARLTNIAKEIYSRTGGLDLGQVAAMQKLEEGLARYYGQEYKPSLNWAALMKQQAKGGGGKMKDYTIVAKGDIVDQVLASSAAEAAEKAMSKYGEDVVAFEGDPKDAAKVVSDMQKLVLKSPNLLEPYGVYFKKEKVNPSATIFGIPIGGEEHYVAYNEQGRRLSPQELKQIAFKHFVSTGKLKGAVSNKVTAANNVAESITPEQRSKLILEAFDKIKKNAGR